MRRIQFYLSSLSSGETCISSPNDFPCSKSRVYGALNYGFCISDDGGPGASNCAGVRQSSILNPTQEAVDVISRYEELRLQPSDPVSIAKQPLNIISVSTSKVLWKSTSFEGGPERHIC